MTEAARILFEMTDYQAAVILEDAPGRILAVLGLPATDEVVGRLRALLQEELDTFVQRIFGTFDNIGCALPEGGPLGYTIAARPDGIDIRWEEDDYADMWLQHLIDRGRFKLPPLPPTA